MTKSPLAGGGGKAFRIRESLPFSEPSCFDSLTSIGPEGAALEGAE